MSLAACDEGPCGGRSLQAAFVTKLAVAWWRVLRTALRKAVPGRHGPRVHNRPMIRQLDPEAIAVTLGVSVFVALIVVGLRIWLLQRARRGWQMDTRKQTERLGALLAACRALGGSFTPATTADQRPMEEALADLMIFGSPSQLRLAAEAAAQLSRGELPDCQALVDDLRTELRSLLGLEAMPADLRWPPSGPGRAAAGPRGARRAPPAEAA